MAEGQAGDRHACFEYPEGDPDEQQCGHQPVLVPAAPGFGGLWL
jgi:hypothetical protein